MRIAGIIAEYNPFHNGHAHQISLLRGMGFDAIVCVCSPSVVQRGTPALFPAHTRTRAALAGGADLILSLPAPYATLSAEGFALAGVALLASLGVCEAIAFGAEAPDADALCRVARILQTDAFTGALREKLVDGAPFAAARAAAAEAVLPGAGALLASPNNILGIEYCKALDKFSALTQGDGVIRGNAVASALIGDAQPDVLLGSAQARSANRILPYPLPLPRTGANHDAPLTYIPDSCLDGTPPDVQNDASPFFASATALRALVTGAEVQALAPYVPPACLPFYIQAAEAGHVASPSAFSIAVLSRLRAMDVNDFTRIRGVREGLDCRLFTAVRTAATVPQLYDALKTKRYAHARVRRLVLDAALGYTDVLPSLPPYLHVLGASRIGLAVLKPAQKSARLPLSHSLRILEQTGPAAAAVARAHAAAEDLAALCLLTPLPQGTAYTDKAVILPASRHPGSL